MERINQNQRTTNKENDLRGFGGFTRITAEDVLMVLKNNNKEPCVADSSLKPRLVYPRESAQSA